MLAITPRSVVLTMLAAALAASPMRALPQPPSPQGGDSQRGPSFSSAVDLVALNVTVSDESGRAVTALKKEEFKVYEDGVEQPISLFSAEQTPATWGLVLDRSGSMREMIEDVYQAAVHTIEEGTDEDEMFIVTFNDQIDLNSNFVTDRHRLENAILGLRAAGETALWDAVSFALGHIRSGRHRKKILVVITDGEDNRSMLPFRGLIERAEQAEARISPAGMMSGSMGGLGRLFGGMSGGPARGELEKLAVVTGARAHFPTGIRECRDAMREIAREVSHQYSIGYYPSNTRRDGKWRKIRVEMTDARRASRPNARTRTGYYAPSGSSGP